MGPTPPPANNGNALVQQIEEALTRVVVRFNSTKRENRYIPILASAAIGAGISLIPSLIMLRAQATIQDQQAMRERKIRALGEFSQVVYGDTAKFVAKEYAFETLVRRTAEGANATPRERQEIADEAKGFQEELLELIGRINISIGSVNAIFNTNLETVDLLKTDYAADDPSLKDSSSTVETLIKIRKSTLQMATNLQQRIRQLGVSIQK